MNSLHDRLVNHYNNFSDIEKSHINTYDFGHTFNHYLWEKHNNPRYNKEHLFSGWEKRDISYQVRGLDKALANHHAPEPLTVYSSTRHDPRKLMNSENVVHHPAYISSSIDKSFAKNWNNTDDGLHHLLKIDIPKGHTGAYIAHIAHEPHQKEFLLPRGLNLKYKGTKLESKKYSEKDGTSYTVTHHVHHMEII